MLWWLPMQTAIEQSLLEQTSGQRANDILRSCVHCGFCNATCPTYQLLGDELDGPRGRIYLIKQSLESQHTTRTTLRHLDRCLTCRACETTCPSGVAYGELLEIGRHHILQRVKRPWRERLLRRLLRLVLPYSRRFRTVLNLANLGALFLPRALAGKLRQSHRQMQQSRAYQPATHTRRVLLLDGCAQQAIRPDINHKTAQVLDRLGITALHHVAGSGCCGAVSQHLDAPAEARNIMRRNLDAWTPVLDQGVEAVISTASACSLMLKDYGRLLADDTRYRARARRVSELAQDISEFLSREPCETLRSDSSQRIAVHLPCTAQHGQTLSEPINSILSRCGYTLTEVEDSHLCCGSAGTYSVLQPKLSQALREQRLQCLQQGQPNTIVTANIGCLLHLQSGTDRPVKHWIELLAT